MQRILLAALVVSGLLLPSASASASDGSRAEAQKVLEAAGEKLLRSIADVNETQWSFQPADRRHSIGELAEHAALSTNALLRLIKKTLEAQPAPDAAKQTAGKVDVLREVLLDPEDPPDKFKPSGKLTTKADVLEFFPQARRKAMALLESAQQPERKVYEHPSERIGVLNGLQWFYYVALLTQSHAEQIEQIKKDPAYPKS